MSSTAICDLILFVSSTTICNLTVTKIHNKCERIFSIDMISNLLWYVIQQCYVALLLLSQISVPSTLLICANSIGFPQYFFAFISLLYMFLVLQQTIDTPRIQRLHTQKLISYSSSSLLNHFHFLLIYTHLVQRVCPQVWVPLNLWCMHFLTSCLG